MKKIILTVSMLVGLSAQANPFQVITYNTALARAYGYDFVPCVLGRLEAQKQNVWRKSEIPTVFIFQEVFYQKAYDALNIWAQNNNFYITVTDSLRNGLVVISEFPIKKEKLYAFSCNAFAQNRGVLDVRIDVDGTEVRILNSHTQDSMGEKPNRCQTEQLQEVAENANIDPVATLLAGDFNVGPDIKIMKQQFDPIEKMWAPFAELMSGWQRAESEKKGVTWNTDKNPIAMLGPQLSSTLDHIFVNRGLNIIDNELMYQTPLTIPNCQDYQVETGKSFMSDHFGLKAKVELRN